MHTMSEAGSALSAGTTAVARARVSPACELRRGSALVCDRRGRLKHGAWRATGSSASVFRRPGQSIRC